MKKYIIIILIPLLFFNCEDWLEVSPEVGVTEDEVYSNYYSVRGYLDKCYTGLEDYLDPWNQSDPDNSAGRDGFRESFIGSLADETTTNYQEAGAKTVLNPGTWLDKETMSEVGWTTRRVLTLNGRALPNAMYAIRIANNIIQYVPGSNELTQDQKDDLLGQAYFFRAWYYFQTIKRFGGMFILDKPFTPNDNLDIPRLTYQESHEWMMGDLDKAIELLPDEYSEAELGRVTKLAAMAVKELAELYAASPLMQNDLNSVQIKDYNIERCENAASYANDVLKYLEGKSFPRLMDSAEYTSIFYHSPNYVSYESIWYRNNTNSSRRSDLRAFWITQRYAIGTGIWAYAVTAPTWNMVEKYEILPGDGNAYPQDDPRANFDPQNPYANRDPRFRNNFVVPGEAFGINDKDSSVYLETWVEGPGGPAGQDVFSDAYRNTKTSMWVKKYMWETANAWQKRYEDYNYNSIYIRVSQVYLDYAEAMNEAYGPTSDPEGYGMTAVDAVNVIRNRIGMPDVLAEHTVSKEIFRERIRNERAVELFCENNRWWDLRRWMIAHEVLKKPIQGIRAELAVAGPTPDQHVFDYSIIDLADEPRVFEMKHYWYPLPKDHIEMFYNVKQNPGW